MDKGFGRLMRQILSDPTYVVEIIKRRAADVIPATGKTQVFMFHYERINSTRKFTIVVETVSLLKKIYKRDAPFRAVFKVKTLAVSFPPYPREMKTNTAKFNLPPFCRLLFSMGIATHSHARSIARSWLKHAHSFDRFGGSGLVQHRKSAIHGLAVKSGKS